MDSSRDCRGRTQPKQKQCRESASSSVDQTPKSQLSAANRPSPNNAQGDTIAQNDTTDKAQSRSRRFSRGRKRPEDKSSTVGAANKTDAVIQPSLNNVQDCAMDDSGEQNGTRKRRKRRARTRREENVSDVIKNDDNGVVQNDATGSDSTNHSGIGQNQQRRLQEIPKANKIVAVKGIDDSGTKSDGSKDDLRALGKESRVQDNEIQKQGRSSQKRSEQRLNTAKENRQQTLSQNGQLNGATRDLEERQDKMKKQGTTGDKTKVETEKSDMANRQGKELPQNDQPIGTTGEGGSQDSTRKPGKKRSRNRRKANNEDLVESDSAMKQPAPQDGLTGVESGIPNGTNERNSTEGRARAEDGKGIITVDGIKNNPALSNDTANDLTTREPGIQIGACRVQHGEKVVREKKVNTSEVNNNSSKGDAQVKATQNGTTEKRLESVPDKEPKTNKRKAKKKKQKTGSQLKSQSLEAMRNLLSESPEEIVNWLILEQSSLFGKKQQKRKDEVVALLVKLLAKACDCECHSDLGNLFNVLSKSWFLTRRVGPIFDQVAAKKSRRSQAKHFDLETIRDLAKVLKEILNRFPKASANLPIVKLHSCTMKLARSGELVDREISSITQGLMKLTKKEEVTRCRQEAMRRSRPVKTVITDDNSEPPENFRELSIIPTREDIIAQQDQDHEPFLRRNKVHGRYHNEEHYLDVQFRLLREDFLRPLRVGIQQLMARDSDSDSGGDRLQDVRIYENVKILYPVCTSNGVAYKINFDIANFQRVQWENSKRLIFGSLLCLSKDNFNSFAFATVASRELNNIRKGEIEVRFVSRASEAGLQTGDLCQMVESIAFFEAYRPVLEGLKMMPPGEFPLQRYIVKCRVDVRAPAYLTKGDGQHVVYDFSVILSDEESRDEKSSSVCLAERMNNCDSKASGSLVSVLNPASWPSAKDLELDDSQFKALQLALTKEFAVIQGPPGTGKTYIGLKIAKVLLHNISAWNKTGGPILVVCFTNHALDQFLEGIHSFHPDGIVRVGGRSKSETIQECSLSKLKDDMTKQRKMPAHLRQAYGAIKNEMESLSQMIEYEDGMLDELTRNVFHEDELVDISMTQKHYDSLTRGTVRRTAGKGRKESVIPQWLGLPVQPADPYQEGFSQPLVMFPFNKECRGMEYFSQADLAFISPCVQIAPGADDVDGGSLELAGTYDSFIQIPNMWGGFADAGRSITLLAFIYPTGSGGPILSYDIYGFGVQLWHEGCYGEMGVLSVYFMRRDLMVWAPPLGAPVLNMNAWNFIGVSYDHDSGMARLWHNGNEVAADSIGKNFDLATQFFIRIGALASPWQEYFFAGRISHLHIYAEALTVDNIRAVGGIQQGMYKLSQEHLNVDSDEEADEINDDSEEVDANRGKPRDFDFEADVMQDQRILDTDAVLRFESNHSSDHLLSMDDPYETPSFTEGDVQNGSWQFQNPNRIKQKIKRIIRRELNRDDAMSEEDAAKVEDVWSLSEKDRWCLYRRWVCDARKRCYEAISDFQVMFDKKVDELKEVRRQQDYEILKNADVVGMTTTGAARCHSLLQDIQPAITIVEEAAEVLEAHIVTSLTHGCQHLILIGDHQQLRPNPTVYDLQKNYDLDVSLFERMVTNGMLFSRLSLQHRMRPQIAKMLDHIYVEPKLQNHESVLNFEDIKGVERNLFFVDHNKGEKFLPEGKSRSNDHEAKFLAALCRYFIQQGYLREQITILTAYSGQLLKLRREMSEDKTFFEGVRVTAVDNFQGEENDIILLSLVRSDSIGFLKIANRVCVALSRARKGFYIIGNATLLEGQDPDLWKKIIADMREQENLGDHLKLVCQNHPQNVIHASSAEDFEDAPEGGCKEPCGRKLDCGHDCDQYCHPADLEHKERFACQKPCTKTCEFGHNCRRTCGEECGPCMVRVLKVIPDCNHEQQVPCSVDRANFKCMELMPKQASPCGHVNQVQCSVAPSDIACQEPCGKLECGHTCWGSCDRCQDGRLHLPCDTKCSRTLFCGHACQDTCVRPCPPCSAPCGNYCDHQQCRRNCGHPCQPCAYECTWQCPHHKCTVPCGEICNRPRCDEPCPEKLSCGHSCVGVCGEVCPKLCRVCNEDEFGESEPGAMFVELLDCGHVFEVNMLDTYMDKAESDVESENDREDVVIRHKLCPTCSIPILYSRRYGNIVKKILADFEAVKRRAFLSDVASIVQIQRIRKELKEIRGIQKKVLEEIDRSVTSGRLTSEEVITCQNQVTLLKFLGNLVTKHKITKETSSELHCKINIITSRIMSRRGCFSEQELKEFPEELSRTELLACFQGLMTALESKSVNLGPEDESSVDTIRSALDSGKALAHQRRKDFMAHINRIIQRHGLAKVVEATDRGSELKDMIVKSTNLTHGPWYKCSEGAHVYCVAESTGGAGSIRCPECLAESRRTAQSPPETVPSPMKLSQLMNMTFKNGFVTPGTKRKRRKRPGKKTSKPNE